MTRNMLSAGIVAAKLLTRNPNVAYSISAMDIDLIFQALADVTRRTLLERIRANSGQSLSRLALGLNVSRQAAAKHMGILEKSGLVVSRRVGRERHHYLNPLPFRAVSRRWLRQFEQVKLMDLMPEADEANR